MKILSFLSCCLLFFACSPPVYKTSVATIVHPGSFTKSSIIEYYANGKRYTVKGPLQKHLAKGDKFELRYRASNPYRKQVLLESPVFLPEEKISFTHARIRKCITGNYSRVRYTYWVNGKHYQRTQWIKDVFNAEKGSVCDIAYWKDDPQRSVMLRSAEGLNKNNAQTRNSPKDNGSPKNSNMYINGISLTGFTGKPCD